MSRTLWKTITLVVGLCGVFACSDGDIEFPSEPASHTSGASSGDVSGVVEAPAGLSLSFDDDHVDMWFGARDLFLAYDARVTFSVSRPHRFTPEEFERLRILQADGHEIAVHTMNHVPVPEAIAEMGVEVFLEDEIRSVVRLLEREGLTTTSFTYPKGERTRETDLILLAEFAAIRSSMNHAWRGLEHFERIFTFPGNDESVGAGLDAFYGPDFDEVDEALERASSRGEVVSFYAHRIVDRQVEGDELAISRVDLERVLAKAREQGLAFYTLTQIREAAP